MVIAIPNVKKRSPQRQVQMPSDPYKAYRMGHSDGFTDGLVSTMVLVVWTLRDNEFLNNDEVKAFMDRYKSTLETINSRNMNIDDIRKSLKKEYNLKVSINGRL